MTSVDLCSWSRRGMTSVGLCSWSRGCLWTCAPGAAVQGDILCVLWLPSLSSFSSFGFAFKKIELTMDVCACVRACRCE